MIQIMNASIICNRCYLTLCNFSFVTLLPALRQPLISSAAIDLFSSFSTGFLMLNFESFLYILEMRHTNCISPLNNILLVHFCEVPIVFFWMHPLHHVRVIISHVFGVMSKSFHKAQCPEGLLLNFVQRFIVLHMTVIRFS